MRISWQKGLPLLAGNVTIWLMTWWERATQLSLGGSLVVGVVSTLTLNVSYLVAAKRSERNRKGV